MDLIDKIKLKLIDASLQGRRIIHMQNSESSSLWIFSENTLDAIKNGNVFAETPRLVCRWFPANVQINHHKELTMTEACKILEKDREWIKMGETDEADKTKYVFITGVR